MNTPTFLKNHMDKTLRFEEHRLSGAEVLSTKIVQQELHLGIPVGTGEAQLQSIQRAVEYAKGNNINVKIYEVR